ncbi:MAG: hypothetical protein M1835_001837 [Candelina submexicana]|nr:MAG: hypothetical protein M1835_001837 [Candelina submexicana]
MADLDAELLALAGDDTSSDEAETKLSTNHIKSESPSSTPRSPTGTSQRDSSSAKAGPAQKKVAKAVGSAKKSAKKGKRDDSEEEGEASSAPSSPNSLQSASMSESESDTSPGEAGDDGPVFPLENKYYSEADKAEIMSMSEIQREEILAERAQILERNLQDLHLRRLLQAREREEAKAAGLKKRKAGTADLDENQRKSSRQKTTLGGRKVGERSGPLEEYKRQREQRNIEIEQRKRDDGNAKDRRGRSSQERGYSDADAEGESEVEWDDKPRVGYPPSASPPKIEQLPADLRDFNRARVGRSNFAKVCFYPGFEKAIANCFLRVSVGQEKGQNVYRMAQIKYFTEGRPYAMEAPNGSLFVTNQYAMAALGKSEKELPFLACSDSNITEAELARYKRTLEFEQVPIATKSFLNSKVDDINGLINHRFTDQEIQEKLKRAGALQSRFSIIDRNAIANRRKDAVLQGDEAAIAKCDAELAALEGPKLAFGTSLTKESKGPKPPTQQEQLAIINRNNRKANTRDIRAAQIAEREAVRKANEAVARGEAVADTFARVKTRAKFHHDVNENKKTLAPPKVDELFEEGSDRSRAGTPLSVGGTSTPKKVGTPKPSGTPLLAARSLNGELKKKGGIPTFTKTTMDDEIIGAMDFGIEIEI